MTRSSNSLQILRAMQRTGRWALVALLAVFICAQGLAFMHGALHAIPALPGGGAQDVAADVHVHAHTHNDGHDHDHASHSHDGHGGIAALFSAHEDAQDCRLFDGAGFQLPLLVCAALGVLALPSATLLRLLDGGVIARWAALFDARGPPASH